MGAEQLAGVMEIIKRQSAKSLGVTLNEEKIQKEKQEMIDEANFKATAWYSTSELWDDGVIDPRETRNYLGYALAVVYNQEIKGSNSYGVFRM